MGEACGWARVYSPQGVQVSLPLAGDHAGMLAALTRALAAGWLADPPGVAQGERRVDIGYVVRREKVNPDRSTTPIIDLYPADPHLTFAVLSVYLNREEDVDAFERASGVRVAHLPTYVGDNKVERGKKPATDKFVVRVPKPFGVVLTDNPKYDPNETDTAKKKPARLFVRWAEPQPAPQTQAAAADPLKELLGDIGAAEHKAQLQHIWEDEVIPRWGMFTAAQIGELTAAKDRRKAELTALEQKPAPRAGGGRVFDNDRAPATNLPG